MLERQSEAANGAGISGESMMGRAKSINPEIKYIGCLYSQGPYSKLKRKESQEEVGSGEESIPFDANAV